MILVGRDLLKVFTDKHTDALTWVEAWIAEVEAAQWRTTMDIKSKYSSASFLANNVVIFNVKGNSYRLEVQIAYGAKTVLVKWAGTHSEYDKRNKDR